MSKKNVLLINPPIYDVQYWAYWSQPHGLLKLATMLKEQLECNVLLLDCLETDSRRKVKKKLITNNYKNNFRKKWCFGITPTEVGKILTDYSKNNNLDEVWITSIMTYWWESTRDIAEIVSQIFPQAVIRIGGIYPTLCPEHVLENIPVITRKIEGKELVQQLIKEGIGQGENTVVVGEVPEASDLRTDLSLYTSSETNLNPNSNLTVQYAILHASRGCPYNCSYCAQKKINGPGRPRFRPAEVVMEEIMEKHKRFGINQFAFYEDNLLYYKDNFCKILEQIVDYGIKLELFAPEGIEPRALDLNTLQLMRRAGFKKVYLPLETVNIESYKKWNRRHTGLDDFDNAVQLCSKAGFSLRNQEVNAFVLFGVPGESLEDVISTTLYASKTVGSIIPMLFTPVPGSNIYNQYEKYLLENCGFKLHDLNGKLYPFLHLNNISMDEYNQLERFMMALNTRVRGASFNIFDDTDVSKEFRFLLLNDFH
ncbi:B12-binding domain-containing radical SAM protein [Desulfotomaculum nigrificans]|uniref:B12-binding domain-containing radical SAM protein n=1 Tax=Desulfotomaculum nigrificans TaxID=1565 RepID=UPI0001FAEB1A|nr:radical SAM protein [Desulfotomaculum nigrificans]